MGKIIYLNFNTNITTKTNTITTEELRLEQIKKDYYKSLHGRPDTVANYTNFLIRQAKDLEDGYRLLGY